MFDDRIFPVLTPLAVDPGHPFPYISNLSLNLAVLVRNPRTGERRFARVKVPPLLPRFVVLPDGERFVPLEQIIAARLGELFPGMEIESHYAFRVTRNADLDLEEEEADDLLAAIDLKLRRRRFGEAVRLEVDRDHAGRGPRRCSSTSSSSSEDDVYEVDGPLDLGGLWAAPRARPARPQGRAVDAGRTRPALAGIDEHRPTSSPCSASQDVLVHHPYESFTTSVEAFIHQAAADPSVLAIKQTLYRTSGDSAIVKALIDAAEAGKQVVVLVELKARFDEKANIAWARALEEAGVHVVYGLVGLKTHTKTALVVRERGRRPPPLLPRRHRQLQPQDRPPLRGHRPAHRRPRPRRRPQPTCSTSSPATAATSQYKRLLVATTSLRARLTELIRNENERSRRLGPDRHEDEQPGRLGPHRRPVRGVAGRREHRPHRPGHLLPAPRRARPVGEHPGAVDRRPLPRALADLRLRRPGRAPLLHRLGRPHAPQPRPAGGGGHPGRRPRAHRPPPGDPRRQPGRRRPGLGARRRRRVAPGDARPGPVQHPRPAPGAGRRPGPPRPRAQGARVRRPGAVRR